MNLICVVGARPNFMKVAPILAAASGIANIHSTLVHTGQHYDERMSTLFFTELGLPQPDVYLGVGSGSHAVQTGRVMIAFDEVLDSHAADIVIVVGDVNSTLACALVAVKRGVPVAHVEAGLRSGDRQMPEEINRILTDQTSTYLFTTERAAQAHLEAEGVVNGIHFVGNVMIDTLLQHRERARQSGILPRLGLEPKTYAVCTLHRPSNVDTYEAAANTVQALKILIQHLPVVLPLHPRTQIKLSEFGLLEKIQAWKSLQIIPPLGYLEFLALMDNARLVFTDSGGIQEETTVLSVPCLTFRENTERPITVSEGTNRLIGTDPARLTAALEEIDTNGTVSRPLPELWDGKAAERILAVLLAA